MANPGYFDNDRPWVSGESDLFFPVQGLVHVSAKSLFPQREVTNEAYTSIGSADQPLVAGAVEYRQPAAGLNEQKYKTDVVAIDPKTLRVINDTEVLSVDRSNSNSTYPTGSNSSVLAVTLPSGQDYVTRGYDATTGAIKWERPGGSRAQVLGAISLESPGNGMYYGQRCSKATGVDVATGADLFTMQYVEVRPEWCTDVRGLAAVLDKFTHVGAGFDFDARTGARVKVPGTLRFVDSVSGLIASEADGALVVSDPATGSVKWQLDKEKVSRLSAQAIGFYGGKLYLKTTDQKPVVDISTGQTIVDIAGRFPTAVIDDWVVFSDGTLEPATVAKSETIATAPASPSPSRWGASASASPSL